MKKCTFNNQHLLFFLLFNYFHMSGLCVSTWCLHISHWEFSVNHPLLSVHSCGNSLQIMFISIITNVQCALGHCVWFKFRSNVQVMQSGGIHPCSFLQLCERPGLWEADDQSILTYFNFLFLSLYILVQILDFFFFSLQNNSKFSFSKINQRHVWWFHAFHQSAL